jgi:glycosyltransferase involved in cell wall biosynthesis
MNILAFTSKPSDDAYPSGALLGQKAVLNSLSEFHQIKCIHFTPLIWSKSKLSGFIKNVFELLILPIQHLYYVFYRPEVFYINGYSSKLAFTRMAINILIFLALNRYAVCLVHVRNANFLSLAYNQRFLNVLNFMFSKRLILGLQYPGLSKQLSMGDFRTRYIPNFIDQNSSEDPPRYQSANFVFCSSRFRSKGVLSAVRAFRSLKVSSNHLFIAGAAVERSVDEELRELVANHTKITDVGVIDHVQVRELFDKCDFLILPTRYPAESVPRVVIEGLSRGLIPVLYDHAGISEEFSSVAFIVKDEQELTKCLAKLVKMKPEEIIEHKKNCKHYFDSRYSKSALVEFSINLSKNL